MTKSTPSPDHIASLREAHQRLKRQVAALDRRAILTPTEQRLVTELKKRKLATKDALAEATPS